MYGIKKMCSSEKLKNMTLIMGLQPMEHLDRNFIISNTITFTDLVDFAYNECLHLIPFEFIDAFNEFNNVKTFETGIKDHLHISLFIRTLFENHYYSALDYMLGKEIAEEYQPFTGITNFFKTNIYDEYDEAINDKDFYDQFISLNKTYPHNYYRVEQQKEWLILKFQHNFYWYLARFNRDKPKRILDTCCGGNPLLSSRVSKNFIEIDRFVGNFKKFMMDCNEPYPEIWQYLMEQAYNSNLITNLTHFIYNNKFRTIDSFKVLSTLSLLPNVFSRCSYIEVLCNAYKNCFMDKGSCIVLLEKYLNAYTINLKGILHEDISSKALLKDELNKKYSLSNLLGNPLSDYFTYSIVQNGNKSLEQAIIRLALVTLPIMEGYIYYLLSKIFSTDYNEKYCYVFEDYKNFRSQRIYLHDNSLFKANEGSIDFGKEDIFNILAYMIYDLKQLHLNDAFSYINNLDILRQLYCYKNNHNITEFETTTNLLNMYNSFILNKEVLIKTQYKLIERFEHHITNYSFIELLNKYRSNVLT